MPNRYQIRAPRDNNDLVRQINRVLDGLYSDSLNSSAQSLTNTNTTTVPSTNSALNPAALNDTPIIVNTTRIEPNAVNNTLVVNSAHPLAVGGIGGKWSAHAAYYAGFMVQDSNNNIQIVQQSGTSGGTKPNWSTVPGTTTNDPDANGVIWLCLGPPSGIGVPVSVFGVQPFTVHSASDTFQISFSMQYGLVLPLIGDVFTVTYLVNSVQVIQSVYIVTDTATPPSFSDIFSRTTTLVGYIGPVTIEIQLECSLPKNQNNPAFALGMVEAELFVQDIKR